MPYAPGTFLYLRRPRGQTGTLWTLMRASDEWYLLREVGHEKHEVVSAHVNGKAARKAMKEAS